jgi:hypothetical protein
MRTTRNAHLEDHCYLDLGCRAICMGLWQTTRSALGILNGELVLLRRLISPPAKSLPRDLEILLGIDVQLSVAKFYQWSHP